MTAIIGYATKLLSIILIDNRINWGNNQEFGFEDGKVKLVDLPELGWAGGAGLSVFCDHFKKSLAEAEVYEAQKVIDVFNESVSYSKSMLPEFSESIDESIAVASWLGASEGLKDFFFRVGVLSKKEFGNKMGLLNENELFIVYPPEYLNSIEKVNEFEGRFNLKVEYNGNISVILEEMFHMFEEISQNSKFVSTTCDVGLFFLATEGFVKAKISGEISELIEDLEKGKIDTRIEVVKVIS